MPTALFPGWHVCMIHDHFWILAHRDNFPMKLYFTGQYWRLVNLQFSRMWGDEPPELAVAWLRVQDVLKSSEELN